MIPVHLDPMPLFHSVAGVQLGTCIANIRYKERDDLLLVALAEPCHTAGVFTQNHFAAPAVQIAQACLARDAQPRYLLFLAGNANAGTGHRGMKDMQVICQELATLCQVPVHKVLPFTTGVIGEYLPVDQIMACLPACHASMACDQWQAAAQAIMTTDTQAKGSSVLFRYHDQLFTVNGFAKGSGMIAPNMATMLAFIATDAYVPATTLQHWVQEINALSFNAISVDGDTSTNDAFIISATGCKRHPREDQAEFLALLKDRIMRVALSLAQQIVRDGEGASKFITIIVEQAENTKEAKQVARKVADSPLVKTAFFAGDPNWGRILMAVGNAGLKDFNPECFELLVNEVPVVQQGMKASGYHEALGKQLFAEKEITLRIRLGRGTACARVWTCDLSYDYIRINAAYRS